MTSGGEDARLAELLSFRILDTPAESAYDALAAAAGRVARCPMALVSLLDASRQWFKAHQGLDVDQTPREHAFCEHALRADAALVVTDATKDSRFASNPLVTGSPNIRFYAGFPLRTSSGAVLGTLCVLDTIARPEGLTAEQADVLSVLADHVVTLLELRRAVAQQAESLREIAISHEQYKALAEHASDIVSRHTADGTTLYVSPSITRVLGYDAAAELGHSAPDRVHPQDAGRMFDAVSATLAGELTTVTVRSRHADGGWRDMEIRLSPIRGLDDEVRELHSVARDVSEQQAALSQLQLSENRFRTLFDANPVGQVELSPDAVITRVNRVFADLVGVDPALLVGVTPAWATAVDEQDEQRVALLAARRQPGVVQNTDRTIVRPDGSSLEVAGTLVGVAGPDGATALLISSVIDVTERNLRARELTQLAAELADARDEAVRQSALTATVLDTVHVGIVACDADGHLTVFNRTTRDFHGLPADPTIDPGAWADRYALFSEDGTTPLAAADVPLYRALNEGAIKDVTITIAPAGLPRRLVRCDGRAMTDSAGMVLGAVVVMDDITQSRADAKALADQAAFTRVLLETAHSGIWACDSEGLPTYVNQEAMRLLGWTGQVPTGEALHDETFLERRGQAVVYDVNGVPLERDQQPLARALVEGEVRDVEITLVVPGQDPRSLLVHASAIRDADGVVTGAVTTAHDVSDLRASEARFRAAFHDGPTPAARIDGHGVLIECNPALRRLLGRPSHQLVQARLADLTHPEDRRRLNRALHGNGTGSEPVEIRLLRVNGQPVWCEVATTAVIGSDHKRYLLSQFLDVDARKATELLLESAAHHDALTGLGNRKQLKDHVATLLAGEASTDVGLLFIDLDGFKAVNDQFGHEAGDAVLVEVAARLRSSVRPGDLIVRLGGDEFVVVCPLPPGAASTSLELLRTRVETAISAAIAIESGQVTIGASVGVAVRQPGQSQEQLLDAADRAMYARKARTVGASDPSADL